MKTKNQINKYKKVLASVLCLSLIQLAPKSVFAEGTDGGGGGNFRITYGQNGRYDLSHLEKDFFYIERQVEAVFRAHKPNSVKYANLKPLPLDPATLDLLYNGKPNIFEVINETLFTFKDQCIFDSQPHDAYAYKDKSHRYICVNNKAIEAKYNSTKSRAYLIALMAHEYSHLVGDNGLTEEQATLLQEAIEQRLKEAPMESINLLQYPRSYYVSAIDILRENLSNYLDLNMSKISISPRVTWHQLCSSTTIDKITMLKRLTESDLNNYVFNVMIFKFDLKYFEDTEIMSFLIASQKWDNIVSSICGKPEIFDGLTLNNPFASKVVDENGNVIPVAAMSMLEYVKAKYKPYMWAMKTNLPIGVPVALELILPHKMFAALIPYVRNLEALPKEENLFEKTQIRNLVAQPFSNETVELIRTELKESIDLLTKYWPKPTKP